LVREVVFDTRLEVNLKVRQVSLIERTKAHSKTLVDKKLSSFEPRLLMDLKELIVLEVRPSDSSVEIILLLVSKPFNGYSGHHSFVLLNSSSV
jgi:hypothetical protein